MPVTVPVVGVGSLELSLCSWNCLYMSPHIHDLLHSSRNEQAWSQLDVLCLKHTLTASCRGSICACLTVSEGLECLTSFSGWGRKILPFCHESTSLGRCSQPGTHSGQLGHVVTSILWKTDSGSVAGSESQEPGPVPGALAAPAEGTS